MRIRLIAAVALLVTSGASAASQTVGEEVHVTLRLAGDRTTFKNGEPVRVQLVFTSDKPGYVVDTAGDDHAAEPLSIDPETGVHRLQPIHGRDYLFTTELSATPVVMRLAINYWVRFDRPGNYTVSLATRRVSRRGPEGQASGQPLAITTNPVTFRIDATTSEDEQQLITSAAQHLGRAVDMGTGNAALGEQIAAAEELAFLPGDAAALEKYRWYKQLRTHQRMASNAQGVLRRGFMMSWNPVVILAQVERELDDFTVGVTADDISNAVSLAVAVKYPGAVQGESFPPPPPDETSPYSIERARILDLVHQSLVRRAGLAKLQSAGAMLDVLAGRTPEDVVRLVVDGFEQFSVESRVWFASGRWDVIRQPKLGPALRRTLDEVETGSRSYIFPALIDVAPDLAVDPLTRDILDPTRIVSDELVKKMPPSSLSQIAPQLLATIRRMSMAAGQSPGDNFRLEQKIKVLTVVADGTLRKELRDLYDTQPLTGYGVRESLLRYLLKWDPEEGLRRTREAISAKADSSILYLLVKDGPVSALNPLLRDRVFESDLPAASEAARYLAGNGDPEDRYFIEQRILHWRIDRERRLADGEALTKADGNFESAMLLALVTSRRWTLTAPDKERLLAACLTDACKVTMRGR